MMMMQIWQFPGTANRTFLVRFMIIVLLSSVMVFLSLQHSIKSKPIIALLSPEFMCVHTVVIFFLSDAAPQLTVLTIKSNTNNHNIELKSRDKKHKTTQQQRHDDAMSKMPFLHCSLAVVSDFPHKHRVVRGQVEKPA